MASTERNLDHPITPEPAATGYLALIRGNRNFRYLWFGQIVSLLGDWFNLIASASLIAQLTASSGLAIGGLFVIRMLAIFLISPFAGAWADRYNRRTLLILTDIIRAVTVLGFLLVREPGQVWLLYALTALQFAISGVFFPARAAILPDIVEERELGAANALSSATWSVMLAVGAALGGLAAGAWGIYPAFVIDALTFIVSAVLILQVRYAVPPRTEEATAGLAAAMRQYTDGLRYLRAERDILAIALLKAAASLTVSGVFQVAQVRITEQVFAYGEGGAISLGLMFAMVGIGTGVGPILARLFTGDRDRPMRVAIFLSYFASAGGLALVASLASFPAVLLGTLVRGVGVGVNWVFSTQLLLQLLPNRVRGRVFATEFAALTLLEAAATAGGGWALDNSGLSMSQILLVMAGAATAAGLLWGVWVWRGREQRGQAR
jgi:MFS family permease